ncbi:hypothetical protein HY382_02370 [Candidatus Curtissbacteria bacterium]|nr:hypothetical protein [Candidatus Curtissbacteria bacterium]
MPRTKLFLFFLLLFLVSSSQISARNNLEESSNNYKTEYTNYRNNQENYLKSKAAYKSYQTVASKNDAFLKTRDYLKQVDSLYLTYFELLRTILESKNGKNNEVLFLETKNLLDSETRFISDHKIKVENAKNLEELPPLAQELKQRLEKEIMNTSTLSIAVTDYLETASLLNEFSDISSLVQNQIDKREDFASSLFQNWKSELLILNNESQSSIETAKKTIDNRLVANNRIDYEEISISLNKVRERMARASKLFEEIMKVI